MQNIISFKFGIFTFYGDLPLHLYVITKYRRFKQTENDIYKR